MRTGVTCIQGGFNKKRYKETKVNYFDNEIQNEKNLSFKKLKTNDPKEVSPSNNKSLGFTRNILKSLCNTIKKSTKRIFSFKLFDNNEENADYKENEEPIDAFKYSISLKGPFSCIQEISKPDFSTLKMIPVDEKLCIKDSKFVETVSTRMTTTSLKRYLEGKKRVLRRSKTSILPSHAICSTSDINKFIWLIEEDPMISLFLKRDICRRYADKYLLAMVLIYFARAHFTSDEFSRENFFAALYLAHDMEEDHEEIKYEVFPYCLGTKWRTYYTYLLSLRDDLFWALDCRAIVSRKCCEQVMSLMPNLWIWDRERPEYHSYVENESRYSSDDGEFCQPRGPFKSPLWCRACLERECMDSENSYIIYTSYSDSSFSSGTTNSLTEPEKSQTVKKDSGFESFLVPNECKEKLEDSEEDDLDTSLQSNEVLTLSPVVEMEKHRSL